MKKNKILVVIPARGGSKRIPKKNIKKIGNKPMIEWPIKELLNIFKKDQILISTDDLKIKNICEKLGLKVPFLRPKYLSDSFVHIKSIISFFLDRLEKKKTIDIISTDNDIKDYEIRILREKLNAKRKILR